MRRRIKNKFIFVMTMTMLLSMVGCHKPAKPVEPLSETSEQTSAEVQTEPATEPETESLEKVYYLSDADTDVPKDSTVEPVIQAADLGVSEIIERNLPVLYLNTADGTGIDSRDNYEAATLTIDNTMGAVVDNGTCSQIKLSDAIVPTSKAWSRYDVEVRGRGNASWLQFPQKGIMLKFDDVVSLFGMNRAKKYVLIPTYGDPSLIRNVVATAMMGALDTFEYVPGQIMVEIYLNGDYRGVYTLSEKVEVSSRQVNLFSEYSYDDLVSMGDNKSPFLLEIGTYMQGKHWYEETDYVAGLDYVFPLYSERMFVRYPTITEPFNALANEVTDEMSLGGNAIYHRTNYADYIDVDEWIDWFIIMELTQNPDSAMSRSTYFYRRPGGLIQLGPAWDFDQAFGRSTHLTGGNNEIWTTTESKLLAEKKTYMYQLYCDDAFMLRVRDRWDEVKEDLLNRAKEAVPRYIALTEAAYSAHNAAFGRSSSRAEAEAVLSFVEKRYTWIDAAIHESDFRRIYDAKAGNVISNHRQELEKEKESESEAEAEEPTKTSLLETQILPKSGDTAQEFELTDTLSVKLTEYDQWTEKGENATIIAIQGDIVTVNGAGVTVEGRRILIQDEGEYVVSGELTNGQIYIQAGEKSKVHLILENATLHSDFSSPIVCTEADKLIITSPEGTVNAVSDSLSCKDATAKGCIYAACDLTINGAGSLKVSGVVRHGISTDDNLKLVNTSCEVSAIEVGLRGKDLVAIFDSEVTVTDSDDAMKSNRKNNDQKGVIFVQGGKLDLTANDDGLQSTNAVILKDATVLVRCFGKTLNCEGLVSGSEQITKWN